MNLINRVQSASVPLLLIATSAIALSPKSTFAQIVPDTTLPHNSHITREDHTHVITQGTEAGTNLFHSFEEFSLPTGETAFFDHAANIQNIITRITGSNISHIDGVISASGHAHLFLINPNGITFGENASLNLGGSFLATTGESLHFADGTTFSATSPTQPLLTVSLPIGVQFGLTPGTILHSSRASNTGLQVQPGQTLALLGGDIEMNGGLIVAPGGQVELGSVGESGRVGLGESLSLEFPNSLARGNISLSNGAGINVRIDGGGEIRVYSQDFSLSEASTLRAGINIGLGTPESVGGDIDINATGALILKDTSTFISNAVLWDAFGKSGDVNIQANSITASDGAQIFSGTFGDGDAGDVNINVEGDIILERIGTNLFSSGIFNMVERPGVGNAGKITINARSLTITDGAVVYGSTLGVGNAGNIDIVVRDFIALDGVATDFFPSGIYSRVEIENAVGNGGNIRLVTPILDITNGAVISGSTVGQGNAGDITLNVSDTITLDGVGKLDPVTEFRQSSGLFTSVVDRSVGNGGNIEIQANTLNATNGGVISASTFDQGQAGKIVIEAENINLVGVGLNGEPSGIFTPTETTATAPAGEIIVNSHNLSIAQGAVISSLTRNAFSGGDIIINTHLLEVVKGGQIITSTSGAGNAGNVVLNVTHQATVSGVDPNFANRPSPRVGGLGLGAGIWAIDPDFVNRFRPPARDLTNNEGAASGLFARTTDESTGNGGSLSLTTPQLRVLDGATITVSAEGTGNAGNLNIIAPFFLLENSSLTAETSAGQFGNIQIQSENMRLHNNSNITTNALNIATGGNIDIDTNTLVALENSDITANSVNYFGGEVTINALAIFGIASSQHLTPESDITATSERGVEFNGVVNINIPNFDPTQSLVVFPENFVNVTGLMYSSCSSDDSLSSSFRIRGRSGKPPNPYNSLSSYSGWYDTPSVVQETSSFSPYSPIVEASGMIVNDKGNVVLTAQFISSTSYPSELNSPSCGL